MPLDREQAADIKQEALDAAEKLLKDLELVRDWPPSPSSEEDRTRLFRAAAAFLRARAEEAEETAQKVYSYANLYGEYKRRAAALRDAADELERGGA